MKKRRAANSKLASQWDQELISLLPKSCKIFASAGAGFDWVDVDILAARGISTDLSSFTMAKISRYHILQQVNPLSWIFHGIHPNNRS